MVFYMDSRTFLTKYLELENDLTILDAYYVVVSLRIMPNTEQTLKKQAKGKVGFKTVIPARILYPGAEVLYQSDPKEYQAFYSSQLDEVGTLFFAQMLKGVIKKGHHVIFICSPSEYKLGYLQGIARFLRDKYYYPMYDYKKYLTGKNKTFAHSDSVTLKICEKIIKKYKRNQKETETYHEYMERISSYSKSRLKKMLKKRGVYLGDETRTEMIDLLRSLDYSTVYENHHVSIRRN